MHMHNLRTNPDMKMQSGTSNSISIHAQCKGVSPSRANPIVNVMFLSTVMILCMIQGTIKIAWSMTRGIGRAVGLTHSIQVGFGVQVSHIDHANGGGRMPALLAAIKTNLKTNIKKQT